VSGPRRARCLGLALGCGILFAGAGCGQVGPKQVRLESSSVASTATEGATVASEVGRGRLGKTFAKSQLRTLAASASGPADALGKSAAASSVKGLAADTQALALESQRRINALVDDLDRPALRSSGSRRLMQIAKQATDISKHAESVE
jgi:hypothetical protein